MKLFQVDVMDDYECETIVVVGENKEQAEEKVANMTWSCLMSCVAYEIDEIDGYKIILEKVSE